MGKKKSGVIASPASMSASSIEEAPRGAAYVALEHKAEKEKKSVFKQYGVDVPTSFDNEVPNVVDERDQGSPDDWIPRRKEMLRLTSLHPFNSEAPLQTLMDAGFLTPTALHYVRNHGPVPKLSWDTHQIDFEDIHGNVVGTLSMEELTTLFPQRTLPVSLSCAGNRRKEANLTKQSKGFSWGCAAVSTSIWTGVRLSEVLGHFGLLDSEALAQTNFVCFDGVDTLPNGTYGTSVAVGTVLDPAREVLLCWEQNGQRLTPDHGYPVRLMVPGFIGGRSIKWLGKIKMSSAESESWYHYFDNRLPPPNVDQDVVKHDDSWFKKPEYIINDRSINSAISSPQHGEVLSLADAPEKYALKGYAYNGGGRRITRVEITLDNGNTWELANLTQPEQPTPFGRYWCWTFWQFDIDPMLLLQAKEICCRAWDESTNSQPGKSTWSILGMMQNGWFRVKIDPIRTKEGLALSFRHPAPIEGGGWMEDMAPKAAVPVVVAPTKEEKAKEAALPSFTMEQVQEHMTEDDCWIVLHSKVYDATPWLKKHPGGVASILGNAGKDSSKFFDVIHSEEAHAMLKQYLVGTLSGEKAKL